MRISALMLLGMCLFSLVPQLDAVDLGSAKVVSLYESILDTDMTSLIRILAETGTDVVFRAYFRWGGREDLVVYSRLADIIKGIKASLPWIHIMGGITCAAFMDGDHWPNGTVVSIEAKRDMLWTLANGTMPRHFADPSRAYVLDISKPLAREFILEYAYKFIDAGFDSLLFDEVRFIPMNSARLYGLADISDRPYVAAWRQIASAVKDYARTRYNRELLVSLNNGWVNAVDESRRAATSYWPYQDFVTVGVNLKTVETQSIQDDWTGYRVEIAKAYGRVPITMVFLDWGKFPTPLSVFGNLSRQVQVKMLKMLHETILREGFLFVYPLHGGAISDYLSPPYKTVIYDALAQGTYVAIKELTNSLVRVDSQTVTEERTTTITVHVPANIPDSLMIALGILMAATAIGLLAIVLRRRT